MVAFFWRQVAMLTTEDAGHGGFFGYHFVVLLIGCFPASVFAAAGIAAPTRVTGDADRNDHRRWMVILFWVVLILFSIVKTKIVHYSSLCYFPLTYLAALQLERIWTKNEAFGWSRFASRWAGHLARADRDGGADRRHEHRSASSHCSHRTPSRGEPGCRCALERT